MSLRVYEIGEISEPRTCDGWCDIRICKGFWGDEEKVKDFVDIMNAKDSVATENSMLRSVLQAIREHRNIDGECAVEMQKAAAWALDHRWPKPKWINTAETK